MNDCRLWSKRRLLTGVILLILASLVTPSCNHHPSGPPRILVFSKTTGFHHESIADGNVAIQQLGKENQFNVDTTTDASWFTDDSLKKYAAIVFLSTTGNVLD